MNFFILQLLQNGLDDNFVHFWAALPNLMVHYFDRVNVICYCVLLAS